MRGCSASLRALRGRERTRRRRRAHLHRPTRFPSGSLSAHTRCVYRGVLRRSRLRARRCLGPFRECGLVPVVAPRPFPGRSRRISHCREVTSVGGKALPRGGAENPHPPAARASDPHPQASIMERGFRRDIIDNKQNRKHKQREARPARLQAARARVVWHTSTLSLSRSAEPSTPVNTSVYPRALAPYLEHNHRRSNASSPATRRRGPSSLPTPLQLVFPCALPRLFPLPAQFL